MNNEFTAQNHPARGKGIVYGLREDRSGKAMIVRGKEIAKGSKIN
jgi:hypothetical protein